ncbi:MULTISPECIES: hypothetical protein [Clavibacter]|uniref:hypothetical protein n=1 Tax=Clavibacter TaxID=1573 RepID=UPI0009C17D84|nr:MULTISPECIES: hypothetical protein [Clavibacter]MDA3805191.1 hypothetical protein [Clavibacter sp. CT19]
MHERPSDAPRRRRAAAAALLVALSVTALGGCAPSETPDPTPAPAPSLTQEQQDDAAFEDVLSGFLALPFEGETQDDLRPFLVGDALTNEQREISQYQSSQQTVVGKDTYYNFRVTDRGSNYMVAQVCLDVSGTRVLDAEKRDVTPKRDSTISLQLKAVFNENNAWRISDLVPNDKVRACD